MQGVEDSGPPRTTEARATGDDGWGRARAALCRPDGPAVFLFPAVVIVAFVVLVGAGISGSSVAQLASTPAEASGLLMGESRSVRSDEYLVRTPLVVAQQARGLPTTAVTGLGRIDMSVLYDLPTRDWSTAFRPNLWGYSVLPLAQAYAFDWWALSVVLLLGTYALVVVLVRDWRWAVLGAFALWASPFFHWWYLSASLSVVGWAAAGTAAMLASLDPSASARRRWGLTAAAAAAFACFVLAFYPPFQVTVALVLGAVASGVLARRVVSGELGVRRLLAHLAAISSFVALVGAAFVITHAAALEAIGATVYPGERRSTGGGAGWPHLVTAWFGRGYLSDGVAYSGTMFTNESEASSFLLLGVGALVALPFLWRVVARPSNPLREPLIGVVVALLLLLVHMFVALPTAAARFTLLDRVEPVRAILGLGLGSVLLTVMLGVSLRRTRPSRWRLAAASAAMGLTTAAYVHMLGKVLQGSGAPLGGRGLWLTVAVAAVVTAAFVWQPMWTLAVVVVAGAAVSLPVNPLQRGLDVLTDHELAEAVLRVDEVRAGGDGVGHDGWITTSFGLSPVVTSTGVRHLSAVNLYPDEAAWEHLDPDRSEVQTWNRYSHTTWTAGVAGSEPVLSLVQADVVSVTVDLCGPALDRLGVGHVVAAEQTDESCLELVEQSSPGATPWYLYERVGGD